VCQQPFSCRFLTEVLNSIDVWKDVLNLALPERRTRFIGANLRYWRRGPFTSSPSANFVCIERSHTNYSDV